MPALFDLQKTWQHSILTKQLEKIVPSVAQPPRDTIEDRVAIYANGYLWRLIEVLEVIFPYLTKSLGAEKFCAICEAYFAAYPSHYFAIRDVGKDLAKFLATSQEHLVYADLAALEFAISEAVDKANVIPITRDALQKIPQEEWGNVLFTLHPSFVLLKLQTNTVAIYEALIQEKEVPAATMNDVSYCRVWRKELQVYYLVIQQAETYFLQNILQQQTFAEICEKLCDLMPETDVVNYAINQILVWLDEGMIVEARVKETA